MLDIIEQIDMNEQNLQNDTSVISPAGFGGS